MRRISHVTRCSAAPSRQNIPPQSNRNHAEWRKKINSHRLPTLLRPRNLFKPSLVSTCFDFSLFSCALWPHNSISLVGFCPLVLSGAWCFNARQKLNYWIAELYRLTPSMFFFVAQEIEDEKSYEHLSKFERRFVICYRQRHESMTREVYATTSVPY